MAKKPSNETKVETAGPGTPVPSISPKYKCYTVAKYAVGDWRLVTYEVQDDKVIGKTSTDGSDKGLALERMKIAIAKEFFLGK